MFTKEKGKLTNSDCQTLNDVSRETATRDLKQLIDKQLIKPSGQKGAGAFLYVKLNCVIIGQLRHNQNGRQWTDKARPKENNEGLSAVWQKWRFRSSQTVLWLIKV